jgi:hypothetical protein
MKVPLAVAIAMTAPTSLATGALVFFDNQADFHLAMGAAGNVFTFLETFEENNGAPGTVITLPDPLLTGGVPNGPFLTGLDAPNLSVSTSTMGDLVLLTENFLSNTSDIVGPNTFLEDGVLTFTGDTVGVGLDLWVLANNPGSMQVEVFDTLGNSLGSTTIMTPGDMTYFAVQSTTDVIGSIVTSDPTGGSAGDLFDNVDMYSLPAPGAIALLGLAGLIGTRRRRFA